MSAKSGEDQIVGFDKSGAAVRITKERAKSIPYVLIRSNERTDDKGYLTLETRLKDPKSGKPIKARSVHFVDPLDYEITKAPNWTSLNLSELVPPSLPYIAYLPPCCECEEEGCGGGGGGGYNGPGLHVGEFYTGNIESYEGWLESEAEIFIKVKQMATSGTIGGVPYSVGEYFFMITSIYNYDLDGGYWGGWALRRPWSERQVLITINGVPYYNDNFRLQVWDEDNYEWSHDLISEGDFHKNTFSQWGQPWSIGPGPAQVKIYQY
ncbi:MAG: hypothetical protein L0Y80_00045 [Ignavibacteriae bacterium]|nr:hypothetical protein [Ignavibacteriota bacterium]